MAAPLLLDTTVYIDALKRRLPAAAARAMALAVCHHSCVCLAELTHAFGRLDPRHPGTGPAWRQIRGIISEMPPYRLFAPDPDTWGTAGILAGIVFRLSGYSTGQERACLNDALIYLQARKLGCTVLTRNAADFDRLQQLVPDGRILLYRPLQP